MKEKRFIFLTLLHKSGKFFDYNDILQTFLRSSVILQIRAIPLRGMPYKPISPKKQPSKRYARHLLIAPVGCGTSYPTGTAHRTRRVRFTGDERTTLYITRSRKK